jgi:flagellum-specific peptidoglycan hydrolase FlgJ
MLVKYVVGLLIALGIFLKLGKKSNIRPEKNPALLLSEYRGLRSYIGAMAAHESGNYTNKLSREYNNIFSMTTPSKRPQISIGNTGVTGEIDNQVNRWQIYDSYSMAIQDLILWLRYNNFPVKVDGPFHFAMLLRSKGYYTASVESYTKGISKYL